MKLKFLLLIFISIYGCTEAEKKENDKHIFYLHGRIIALQGVNAVSEQFGPYQFNVIIDSLKSITKNVHYTVRSSNTNFNEFCQITSNEIDQLVSSGVKSEDITVIGASKGGVMAMQISHLNTHPINYILLGANNTQIEEEQDWNFHGRILGIYDTSDNLAGRSYDHWEKVSTNAKVFEQVEINTGRGHGFLYSPLNDWLSPTKEWITKR